MATDAVGRGALTGSGVSASERSSLTASQSEAERLAYEDRWSRLLHAVGVEALKRFQTAKILIIGLKGLGLEIAKNVILMGARAVTIHDEHNVTLSDLSSNFYLTEDQVGKNRAEAVRSKLAELNPRVDLTVLSNHGPITEAALAQFTVVVMTDVRSKEEIARVNAFCHSKKIAFIATDTFGLFGYIFTDFGENHIVYDRNGEPERKGFVELITQDQQGLVTLLEGKMHDLEDGDVITFSEVKGMDEVNGKRFEVKVKNPYAFMIGDTSGFNTHAGGGQFQEVKIPRTHKYKPWSEFTQEPPSMEHVLLADYSKFDRPPQYWLAMQALYTFKKKHGRLPAPHEPAQSDEVVEIAKQLNAALGANKLETLDEKLLKRIARQSSGDLSPMAAYFGGIVAQEAIKAASGKFTPLNQWFMFDSLECLTDDELPADEFKPTGTRYDGQIAVFGRTMQQKIEQARYFLVGAGAIGCEMLKNWAMMGLGVGSDGMVTVTDMDAIEVSNLNRQFLYREWDVKKMKSETAANAVKKMNPNMHLKALTIKVSPDTENVYNDAFWEPLTGVCNALDNVQARLYVDGKCVFYRKSLLESGTLGPKGNTQVVVPNLTETYGQSTDPPEKNPPVCLVHSFPHNIEHCLQWGREIVFEGRFVSDPDLVNKYLTKVDYVSTLAPNMKRSTLETIHELLVNRQKNFDECIVWARLLFEKMFANDIKQLLYQFPEDFKDPKTGAPFWSGAKRPPHPEVFDPNNELHLSFVVAATFLRAWNLALLHDEFKPKDIDAVRQRIAKAAAAVPVPQWKPKGNIKIATDEAESKAQTEANAAQGSVSDEDEEAVKRLLSQLPPPAQAGSMANIGMCNVVDFEKDDDRNFHIDLIHAAANIRATQYKIKSVDRLQSKLIAGKIIPAIVTTTASVTGLVCLELYKLLQQKKLEAYRNTFINLALPVFQQGEPVPPKKTKFVGKDITIWDRIELREGDITLQQCIDLLKKKYNIDVDILGVGSSLIFSGWMPPAKKTERLGKTLTELVAEITKKPPTPGLNHVNVEVTGTINDADVDIPPITIFTGKPTPQ